jgi:hypothetical protein
MRSVADEPRIRLFMQRLGSSVPVETRVYFTGGVSAVLKGWRSSTIDLDVEFIPDRDEVLKLLPGIKVELDVNIELASPSHFVPALPGWEERSEFIAHEGRAMFYHYDFYSQALAKIERGHEQDRADVETMIGTGLVDPLRLRELFEAIVPMLFRYPALNPESLRQALESALH